MCLSFSNFAKGPVRGGKRGVAELGEVLFLCPFCLLESVFCHACGHDPHEPTQKKLHRWGSFSGLL